MDMNKDLNDNKKHEAASPIKAFNMCDSTTVGKGTEILTIQDLIKRYNVSWNEKNYNCNTGRVQKLEEIDLRNAKQVRDYITFVVNKKYLEYCKTAKIEPSGMISLPEHMENSYKDFSMSWMSTKKDLTYLISKIVHRYIDEKGVVYNTCYGKQIADALKDINTIGNDAKCDKKDFSILIPQYNDNELFIRIGKENTKDFWNGAYSLETLGTDNLIKQAKIAERVINTLIPKRYLSNPKFILNNEECWNAGGKKDYRVFFNQDYNDIVISTYTDFISIVHEYIHSVIADNWYNGDKEISSAILDFMFEATKGNDILSSLNNNEEFCFKFKPIDKKDPNKYLHYLTRLYTDKEVYNPGTEVLSVLMDELFTNALGVNKVDLRKNPSYPIEDAVKVNFNAICEKYPEAGALLLTFFRGEFKE